MPRFSAESLTDLAAELLVALGTTTEGARTVAEHLVESNLAGHDSHGLIRLSQYCNHAREGTVVPSAVPEIVRESSTTAVIDGHNAWGQIVARRAADLAVEKARTHAIGAVVVRNCYHVGRVGAHLLAATEEGMIGQAFCNGYGMSRVAPWGGTESRLATNPLAFAFPTRAGPIVVDFATSTVAEGKVRLAKVTGRSIPEGWVMDANGAPTSDPNVLYSGGTIHPLGGREGHKGFCLSVAVDLLGGILSGAGAGHLSTGIGNGLFLQVVDPDAFDTTGRGGEAFLDRVDEFVRYLKSSALKPGVEGILLPGEPEHRTTERRRREGLEIDDDSWGQIARFADELKIELPAALDA